MSNFTRTVATMKTLKCITICTVLTIAGCAGGYFQSHSEATQAAAQDSIVHPETTPEETASSVTIHQDIVYGYGTINVSSDAQQRPLLLDAYLPSNPGNADEEPPAIIMAFGGAYHRGRRGDHQFYEDGAHDSSMADYCEAFAKKGIACFSIDYRLTPEDPAMPEGIDTSQLMPEELLRNPLVTGRVEVVRKRMGLPPLDDTSRRQLWNATLAAVEDLEAALDFVRDNAEVYNVNPNRIALGGFSAGAMTAMNLAYGKGADVDAVIALSGTIWGYDLEKTVLSDAPPLLMFSGQWDLAGIRQGSAQIVRLFHSRGISVKQAWVPSFGHFYPMEAPSLSSEFEKSSVLEQAVGFLAHNFEVKVSE
ncbi:MAG: hypothetical protein ABJG15_04035 [Hyphomonadaceae bacterium]